MAFGRIRLGVSASALLLTTLLPVAASAQALQGTGLVATGLLLRRMDGVKRVLMIGAHPDDEDTSILAELSRGEGVQTAYMALTRGEGGQNLLGPELWDGLGVIRTGELEAARRLDGGRQFFSRAFDFGFSRSAGEALTIWPRDALLSDVVWVIRKFRPQVIIAVFSGTPTDGHGHHQASGILTREAFDAAGDPARFPEHLAMGVEAWTPTKLYELARRQPGQATTVFETGAYDPLLGRSELQLSMESRSFHRSQDMGAPQPMGPRSSGVRLERDRTLEKADGASGAPFADAGLFAHVDTTLTGVAGSSLATTRERREVVPHLEAYRAALAEAQRLFGGTDPYAVVAPLRDALGHLEQADAVAGGDAGTELRLVLDQKLALAGQALLAAAGVVLDVRAEDDVVTPGQAVAVTATAWNGGPLVLENAAAALDLPAGWSAAPPIADGLGPDGSLGPHTMATWTFEARLPADAGCSKLYYLRQPRDGYFYNWPEEPGLWGLPRDPAPVDGSFSFSVRGSSGGVAVQRSVPWNYVGVNPARGEFRRPVLVVPQVSVAVTPGAMVWPRALDESRTLTVSVRNEGAQGNRGRVRLAAPAGWSVSPESYDVDLGAEGAERSFAFQVRPFGDVPSGEHVFRAEMVTGAGQSYAEGFDIIDYEHVERAALFSPSEARVNVFPVRVAEGLRVGYIMGTGDDGPDAIRQMGADVTLLDPEQVRTGRFQDFDVVVVGVRAYEPREDLKAANGQLLDYAKAGGTVLVQYNQYDFPRGGYAPFPVDMGRPADRVTDETAEVKVLQPDAPVFTAPNRITQDDFTGWVQERGLYFMTEWDDAYTPLLEMHDRDEAPTRGSLLVAPVGEGVYVYAALSFFRQWSSGVPGAYRLFANLLSLKAKDWWQYRPISQ